MHQQLLQLLFLRAAITAAVGRATRAIAHHADRGIQGQALQIQYTIHNNSP